MSTVLPRGTSQIKTEYEDKSQIEKAVADARYAFQGILGEGHYSSVRTHSLYQLKGTNVNRARAALHKALYHDHIKYGDFPPRYLKSLKSAAEAAVLALHKVKETPTNTERLSNSISQLEDVVDYSTQAQQEAETEKATKAAEELTRFPENKERAQEISMWGMCLTVALDILDNYSKTDTHRDGEGFWSWTPSALASEFSDLAEQREEYREEFTDICNALDDENISGAWMEMYDFAKQRRGSE